MIRLLALTTILFLTLIPATNARAGSGWNVRPMRVNLDNRQRSAALTIANAGDAPALLHAEAMSWEQVDGKDRYVRSEDLIVVPPLLRVEAGNEKVVRLALRGVLSGTRERAFRIFLTEVPPKISNKGPAVQVAVRMGIPVYANASSLKITQAADAGVTPSAQLNGKNRIRLNLVNAGDRHIVINTIRIYADASKSRLVGERPSTEALLAGTSRTFALTANAALTLPTLVVEGVGASGPFDLTVPVMQAGAR